MSGNKPPPPKAHQFKKGQSGNPSGRSRQSHSLADLARKHTELAVTTLVEICRNSRAAAAARVQAASLLLDRGHGKAPVTINHNFDPNQLSDADLAAIAAGSGFAADEEALGEAELSGVRH